MSSPRVEPIPPRSLSLALFAIGLLWLLVARVGAENSAQGIAVALHIDPLRPVLSACFLLILLIGGFTALNWLATKNGSMRLANALPTRATISREWQKGAAVGWALTLLVIVPMALAGDLHPQFSLIPRSLGIALLSLGSLAFGALATEVAFRGFLFRRLIAATGPVTATVVLSALFAMLSTSRWNTTPYSFPVSFLGGLLFSMAYLRTRGLWLGWGLRFGWTAAMGLLFGLPIGGQGVASPVATDVSGAVWLTGGPYGPEGALLTGLVLIVGMVLLYILTRDYAWEYTAAIIVPGGYPMEVAPPPAHTAMEIAAAAPLVQILGSTSTTPSAVPVISDHLQSASARVSEDGSGFAGLDARDGEGNFEIVDAPEAKPRAS